MAEFSTEHSSGSIFELPNRYEALDSVGRGTFGLVLSATDKIHQRRVAIKKIHGAFSTKTAAKRAYREIRLLKDLHHDNVIAMSDAFISPYDDLYIVTGLMKTDLRTLLKSGPLEDRVTQFFLYEILCGLKYIHSADVVHRDIKPSNILMDENGDLKICDFGLARICEPRMTAYVTTRHYSAPEIMLTWQSYGFGVDIWGAACVFAEMLEGNVLFPGKNDISQLSLIAGLIKGKNEMKSSTPSNDSIAVQSISSGGPLPSKERFCGVNPQAHDLLKKMLMPNPRHRISAADALTHKYLSPYHDLTYEPITGRFSDWPSDNIEPPTDVWNMMTKPF